MKPLPTTPKGEATRARIFDAALASFVEHGYEQTTMRAIAERAGTSLGLAYRYFARKDEIVLELYRITSKLFAAHVQTLPRAPLSERYRQALGKKLDLVAPYRRVFASVVAATMDPHGRAWALGPAAHDVRAAIVDAWKVVVAGSDDADELPVRDQLAEALFVAQLAVLFFWLNDDSDGQERTIALVDQIAGGIHQGLGLLFLDETADRLRAVAALLAPVFVK